MVELVIGTATSELIRRRISELATGICMDRFREYRHRDLSFDDRLSEVCDDSLWLQDFIMAIEDEYDITIGMRDTIELETVSDLVELIESKIK